MSLYTHGRALQLHFAAKFPLSLAASSVDLPQSMEETSEELPNIFFWLNQMKPSGSNEAIVAIV